MPSENREYCSSGPQGAVKYGQVKPPSGHWPSRKLLMWEVFGVELLAQGQQGFTSARAGDRKTSPAQFWQSQGGSVPAPLHMCHPHHPSQLSPVTLGSPFFHSLGFFDCLRGLFEFFFFFFDRCHRKLPSHCLFLVQLY